MKTIEEQIRVSLRRGISLYRIAIDLGFRGKPFAGLCLTELIQNGTGS